MGEAVYWCGGCDFSFELLVSSFEFVGERQHIADGRQRTGMKIKQQECGSGLRGKVLCGANWN